MLHQDRAWVELVSWNHSRHSNRCLDHTLWGALGQGTPKLKEVQEQKDVKAEYFSAFSVSRVTEALMGSQDPRVTKARKGRG